VSQEGRDPKVFNEKYTHYDSRRKHAPVKIQGVTLEGTIRRLIARYGRADADGVSMSSVLEDVGVDALGVAQIVIYLEARFGITIAPSEAAEWASGSDIVASLEHRISERHREAS
jgi:acyl carrier protein